MPLVLSVRDLPTGESDTVESPSVARKIPLVRNVAEAGRSTTLTGFSCRAAAQAQGTVDRSFDNAVTATGELNTIRYNGRPTPWTLGLRGAGDTYDGLYYVKNVSHRISKGHYGQSFKIYP